MYKDLIDLRLNGWKLRREQETAKTLNEIRKDVAREERQQAQGFRPTPNKQISDRRVNYNNQTDKRPPSSTGKFKGQPKSSQDKDGWVVASGKSGTRGYQSVGALPSLSSIRSIPKPDPKPSSPTPPPPPKQSIPDELSRDKLENKIKNMRAEYLANQNNTEDVFYTIKEMTGTPNYGRTVVEKNMDFAFECKDPEREGLIDLLTLLYTNGKLSKEDFEEGMAEMVEFVDSFAIDIPNACEYLGAVLSACLHMKALSKEWIREKCQLIATDKYQDEVIFHTEQALSKRFNISGLDALA